MKKMNQDIQRFCTRAFNNSLSLSSSIYRAFCERKIISVSFIHCNDNPGFPRETDFLPRNPAKIHRQSDCKPQPGGWDRGVA